MGDNKLLCANVIYTAASIKVASEQSEKVGYEGERFGEFN